MASLTVSQPIKVGYATWWYTYSGTAPFRRYVNGRLVRSYTDVEEGQSEDTFIKVSDNSDNLEPPVVEVYDSTDETSIPIQYENASQLILQWRGGPDDDFYKVEYYDGAEWIEPDNSTVRSNGNGYYQFNTVTRQADSVQWRITARHTNGTSSNAVSYTVFVVPNPEPPSITGTYAAGTGLLTISAR